MNIRIKNYLINMNDESDVKKKKKKEIIDNN